MKAPEYEFRIAESGSPEHARASALVAAQYLKHFGSTESHAPDSMLCQFLDGALVGCVGFESAESGSLFVEQYLDQPIDIALFGVPGRRKEVVEIGAFAVEARDHALLLMMELADVLSARQFTTAVCTVTAPVRRCLRKLGIESNRLGPAVADRVDNPVGWGTYYELQPEVLAGDIADGLRHIAAIRPFLYAEVA